MIAFRVQVVQDRAAWVGKTRDFNAIVKGSLIEGARLWVRDLLPRHFGPLAKRRYAHQPRRERYNRTKRRRPTLRDWKGNYHPNPRYGEEPADLTYTGELEEYVLGRSVEEYLSDRTASGATGKEKFRVRIGFPHPMQVQHAAEVRAPSDHDDRLVQGLVKRTLAGLLAGARRERIRRRVA